MGRALGHSQEPSAGRGEPRDAQVAGPQLLALRLGHQRCASTTEQTRLPWSCAGRRNGNTACCTAHARPRRLCPAHGDLIHLLISALHARRERPTRLTYAVAAFACVTMHMTQKKK